ncbi:MAG: efflux RND transporter periplasmic adaptor subunit [Bacteroidales bacterium]
MLYFGLLAMCVACQSSDNKEREQSKIIKIEEVQLNKRASVKEFPFIAQPFRTSQLSFRVSGPLRHLDVYAGNYYHQGSCIAEIDPRDFKIRKQSAQALYQQAQAEFERIEILYTKQAISASTYEKAKREYTSAKMALENASNELNDTKLKAPFNGYIGAVYIENYQEVKASQAVVSLVDVDQLKLEIYVTQEVAFRAQELKTLSLCFDAQTHKMYTAKIIEISKSTTQNNLSYLLTAVLPNKDGKLLAGMSGKVFFDLSSDSPQNQLMIRQSAVCHRPSEGDYVWVVNPNTKKIQKKAVKIGDLEENGQVIVKEGLQKGDLLAVSGLRFLSEGMKVKLVRK